MKMKTTIKDIAKAAGVSQTTVSFVLNDHSKTISEATKIKVRRAVEELNYQPNHAAISLVTRKTKTIGLIIPNIGNPFFAELALSIEECVSKQGYNLILCNTNERYQKDIDYLKLLSARRVDGLLIAISPTKDKEEETKIIDTINHLDLPVVAIDRWLTGMNCNRVSIDHRLGAQLATNYLINLGHRQIATITGPLSVYTGRRRLTGFKEALEAHSIPVNEKLIIEGDYSFNSGYQSGLKVLKEHPTAVFVANDMMAFGLLKAAKEMNISIPNDLSIVGFDNLLMSSLIEPQLTTINQPIDELGEKVCEMLFDLIKGSHEITEDIKLKPNLVIRSTTKKENKENSDENVLN